MIFAQQQGRPPYLKTTAARSAAGSQHNYTHTATERMLIAALLSGTARVRARPAQLLPSQAPEAHT